MAQIYFNVVTTRKGYAPDCDCWLLVTWREQFPHIKKGKATTDLLFPPFTLPQ